MPNDLNCHVPVPPRNCKVICDAIVDCNRSGCNNKNYYGENFIDNRHIVGDEIVSGGIFYTSCYDNLK